MTVTADGIWTARSGEGVPVLLCHGGPGLWDMFDDLAATLTPVAAVHRWDQRGCGRSDRRGPYSVAGSLADLDAVRRGFGLDRVVLVGHSWGAYLALRYAIAHPASVSGLVYVSGTGIDPEPTWQPAYRDNLRAALGPRLARWEELRDRRRSPEEDREYAVLQWSADFVRDRLVNAEWMATPWLGVNFECNTVLGAETGRQLQTDTMREACRALDVPTLIVDGGRDIRPRRSVDSLEAALPQVARVTLEGAGHLPWVEDPDGFGLAVREFVGSCAP